MKKLKHIIRMIGTAWHYYGVFLLCCLMNPFVVKFWMWATPKPFKDGSTIAEHLGAWLFTVLSLAAISALLYAHHCLTKWYFGDK